MLPTNISTNISRLLSPFELDFEGAGRSSNWGIRGGVGARRRPRVWWNQL